LTQLR